MSNRQPVEEYAARLASRREAHAGLLRLNARISHGRLAVFAAIGACAWLTFQGAIHGWEIGLLLAAVFGFVGLLVWHDRVIRAGDALARAIAFYERGLARIDDRWSGSGETGLRFLDDDHIYARDLDLFGSGSLFQLLSLARTYAGEDALAGWLKAPSTVPALRLRQQAVSELRDRLDFREALATAGGASREIDTAALTSWAIAAPMLKGTWFRPAAVALAIGIIATGVWWGNDGPVFPFVIALLLKAAFTRAFHHPVARVTHGIERPLRQLDVLAGALEQLEREQLASPRLAELRAVLTGGRLHPSAAIRRLDRLAERLDWDRNMFFAPISVLISWPLHIAVAIEGWRREFGPHVPEWLAIMGEHEALSSLAAYTYEHPADPFPVFQETGPARFEGAGLGHPLVEATRMVRNDVFLTSDVRLLIVSGSNMSGKSTLLRTVGVNAVLAMAGATVRAERLTLTPLIPGATLYIQDSLQAGRSRFFAEITRIRRIFDLAGDQPALLFLLDEVLQGTNSHDRRIGAAAILRSLVDRGAIGLITTHDLALTTIDGAGQTSGIVNVHFDDEFRDTGLVFDYRLKPGPVTRSNALALMRAVGLPLTD